MGHESDEITHLLIPLAASSPTSSTLLLDSVEAKPDNRILDVGYGVGRPMCTITTHSCANVVGITINHDKMHNKKADWDFLWEIVATNLLCARPCIMNLRCSAFLDLKREVYFQI